MNQSKTDNSLKAQNLHLSNVQLKYSLKYILKLKQAGLRRSIPSQALPRIRWTSMKQKVSG